MLIHRLTYRRTNQHLHVRGYKEEGTTTTPFDMCVRNEIDRFHLAIDVLDRVPHLAAVCAHLRQEPAQQADGPLALRNGTRRGHAGNQRMAVDAQVTILVLNAGSSSLKYHLFRLRARDGKVLAKGAVERLSSMADALKAVFDKIGGASIEAVGHRVVHGGERFQKSVIIDSEVEEEIGFLSALAPLHNPHNLEAYRAARDRLPGVIQVAVFDTAFHHWLPPRAYVYGLALRVPD